MKWFKNFEVPQRRRVEFQELRSFVKGTRREVREIAAQVIRQVMQHCAGSANGGSAIPQTEAIERSDFKMFAHRKRRRLGSEYPVVVSLQHTKARAKQGVKLSCFCRQNDLGGIHPLQFCEQRVVVLALGGFEITRREIHHRETKTFSIRSDGSEVVVPLRAEHALVEVRAG